jgi:hypothetical protein
MAMAASVSVLTRLKWKAYMFPCARPSASSSPASCPRSIRTRAPTSSPFSPA